MILAAALFAAAATAAVERQLVVPLRAADVAVSRYRYVPFAVPAGTTRVEVALAFDKAGGANVIDLGLMEPGSISLPSGAFRGWSGGERAAVFVAADDATPGYWPGATPAGTWHVVLGLYRIAPQGVSVTLTVKTASVPPGIGITRAPQALRTQAAAPLRSDARWYAGALHTHTVHSDGRLTPAELAREARAAGLDFLAITDHNNTAQQREPIAVPGLLVITGEEVTTPGGHAGVWGLHGPRAFVDFRVAPGDPRVAELVAAAHAKGALFAINHPFDNCTACSWTHAVPDGIDALEITNPGGSNTAQAIALWDTLLRAGRRVAGIGVSDWHRPGEAAHTIDVANSRVYASELSEPAILAAIKAGRVIVTASAKLPVPSFTVSTPRNERAAAGGRLELVAGEPLRLEAAGDAPYAGGRVQFVWRGETLGSLDVPAGAPAWFAHYPAADGYVRAHFFAPDGAPLAITNPVWVTVKAP